MAETELTSFIGWVDLSDEDQKRARDYLRSLSEGTLDELGFGIIRDVFADLFFPATSTIMTRARYFILVPVIYLQVLEQKRVGARARKKCDELEHKLRVLLIGNKSIEQWRTKEVKRYPASIYWAGLRRLNINMQPGSQAKYFANLQSYFDSHAVMTDDDKNSHFDEDNCSDLWDPELVQLYHSGQIPNLDSRAGFDDEVNLDVTKCEAEYLKRKFMNDELKTTVISNVFKNDSFETAPYPWDWDYPKGLEREIKHARHFSMLGKLATLVYYEILNRRRVANGKQPVERDLVETIETWWDATKEEQSTWDIEEFINWTVVTKSHRGNDLNFFPNFQQLMIDSSSAEAFINSIKVEELIVSREKDKRPSKRRMIPGRFQNEWVLPSQFEGYFSSPDHIQFHLNYRSGVASTIIGDIFEGLARE